MEHTVIKESKKKKYCIKPRITFCCLFISLQVWYFIVQNYGQLTIILECPCSFCGEGFVCSALTLES